MFFNIFIINIYTTTNSNVFLKKKEKKFFLYKVFFNNNDALLFTPKKKLYMSYIFLPYFSTNKFKKSTWIINYYKNYLKSTIFKVFNSIYRYFILKYFLKEKDYIDTLFCLIYQKSIIKFVFLVRLLFSQVPVPKHRIMYNFFRQTFKKIYTYYSKKKLVNSVFFMFKGKLSVTGNKRTRTFKGAYGFVKIPKFFLNEFVILPTTTGVVGFWLHIEY